MTIPKGTEQWECDLIAPSAAPGLTTFEEWFDLWRSDRWYKDGRDGPVSANYCEGYRRLMGTAYAAGQAHPQGQGEVVVTCNQTGECVMVSRCDEDGQVLSVIWHRDAAPAASQAAPATVAEPPGILGVLVQGGELYEVDAPAKAQEPDAVVALLRDDDCPICQYQREEAADRVEQLQAQHEADAERIAELEAERDEARTVGTISYERAELAEGSLRRAVALLERALSGYGAWHEDARAFLAQADARSDKGAG